jgi:hypothetical protein
MPGLEGGAGGRTGRLDLILSKRNDSTQYQVSSLYALGSSVIVRWLTFRARSEDESNWGPAFYPCIARCRVEYESVEQRLALSQLYQSSVGSAYPRSAMSGEHRYFVVCET